MNPLIRCHFASLFALLVTSISASAFEIERSDKLTIIKFVPSDLANDGRVEGEVGWRLSCLIETPPFALPANAPSEVELLIRSSGEWEAATKDAANISRINLAVLEFTYDDVLGTQVFMPLMLRPSDFGIPHLFLTLEDGRLLFYGGSLAQVRQTVIGPMEIPAGAKNLRLALCQIAPATTIHLHELQIRLRPVS